LLVPVYLQQERLAFRIRNLRYVINYTYPVSILYMTASLRLSNKTPTTVTAGNKF